MGERPRKSKMVSMDTVKRRAAVRRDFIRGITYRDDLAARHGVSEQTISKDLKAIFQDFLWDDKKKGQEEFAVAERRLLDVYADASDAFERSKQDFAEVVTAYKPKTCMDCQGRGERAIEVEEDDEDDEEKMEPCPTCEGKGRVIVEEVTKKVKRMVPDPTFLKVKADVIKEMNRVKGHYPKEYGDGSGNQHLHLHQHESSLDLSGVSDDKLLKALAAIDRLKDQGSTINVEAKELPNTSQEDGADENK